VATQTVDPKILTELLEKPDIKKEVERMDAETLEWYKRLIIKTGIYAQYAYERERVN
jgi:hypothetical protein